MKKILVIASALVAFTSASHARGLGGMGGGASGMSPGHQFGSNGPVTSGPTAGPGASGYAPGQQMRAYGPATGSPGASGYAPGRFKH